MTQDTSYTKPNYPDAPRQNLLALIPAAAESVLDVGCWTGAFGAELRRLRPTLRVDGVEPNAAAADLARKRLNGVTVGMFPDVSLGSTYDVITFNDVLEHMADPWAALRTAGQYLASDGHVIAVIPNVRHLSVLAPLVLRGEWRYVDAGILDRTHLRFFTKSTMLRLFQESQFSIEWIQPVDPSATGWKWKLLGSSLRLIGQSSVDFRTKHYAVCGKPL